MNWSKWILTLVIGCGLCSCASRSSVEAGDPEKNILINRITDKDLSEFFTEIDYLPLYLPEDVVFGGIDKILGTSDRFYIKDITGQAIFIFDKNGNFIRRIHQAGRGPNEYLRIDSFALDHQNKKIVLSDIDSRKILLFDFDGNYEKTIHADKSIPLYGVVPLGKDRFANINDGVEDILPSDIKKYNLTVFDGEGNIQESLLADRTPLNIKWTLSYNTQTLEDGGFLYRPILSDTIYRVSPSMTVENYRYFTYDIDGHKPLNNRNLRDINFELLKPSSLEDYEAQGYICSLGSFQENENWLFSYFGLMRYRHFVYYDKNNKQSLVVDAALPASASPGSMTQREMRRLMLSNPPLLIEGDVFYTHIESLFLEKQTPYLEPSELKSCFEEMIALGDNTPCLFLYKIDLNMDL